jgi:hypothetical protein
MINVAAAMSRLSERRPVFHSEADFQHEFAWNIRELAPDLEIRLEYPLGSKNGALDILVRDELSSVAIELKYLCRKMTCSIGRDDFALKNQGAQDIRRYDVFKDIARMERFIAQTQGAKAIVIVLTNDPKYWVGSRREDTFDAAFCLQHGRFVEGELAWAEQTSAGTKRKREISIQLANRYNFSWSDYSRIQEYQFRYLQIDI